MKTRVNVTLTAEEEVVIEVEHDAGENPCDLTAEDEANSVALTSNPSMDWTIRKVRKVREVSR